MNKSNFLGVHGIDKFGTGSVKMSFILKNPYYFTAVHSYNNLFWATMTHDILLIISDHNWSWQPAVN